jgi:hypothetical protein
MSYSGAYHLSPDRIPSQRPEGSVDRILIEVDARGSIHVKSTVSVFQTHTLLLETDRRLSEINQPFDEED